jgi:hypothetical protein
VGFEQMEKPLRLLFLAVISKEKIKQSRKDRDHDNGNYNELDDPCAPLVPGAVCIQKTSHFLTSLFSFIAISSPARANIPAQLRCTVELPIKRR